MRRDRPARNSFVGMDGMLTCRMRGDDHAAAVAEEKATTTKNGDILLRENSHKVGSWSLWSIKILITSPLIGNGARYCVGVSVCLYVCL